MIAQYLTKIKDFIAETKNKLSETETQNLIRANKKYFMSGLVVLFTICFFAFNLGGVLKNVWTSLSNLFSNVDGEVKQVVIKSSGYDSDTGGHYQITKSADWTGINEATLELKLDTKVEIKANQDVILLLDNSNSMADSGADEKAKSDIDEFLTKFLAVSSNKIALATFNSTGTVQSGLTTDKDTIIDAVSVLTPADGSNYYQGLLAVEELLEGYTVSADRDLTVVVITDGNNLEGLNAIKGQLKILEGKYSNIKINILQYATQKMDSTLSDYCNDIIYSSMVLDNNNLYFASKTTDSYETFKIVEYIDNEFFYVETDDDIKVSTGTVELLEEGNTQKVIWTVPSDEYATGESSDMTIKLQLQDSLKEVEGLYPISTKTTANLKVNDRDNITLTSEETNILKNGYKITYDVNYPTSCSGANIEEIRYAQNTVILTKEIQKCDGWQFSGWEMPPNVLKVNDNAIIMPNNNISLTGKWTQLSLNKTQEGVVYENTCDDKYEIGTEITLAGDTFNVINDDCETVTLLGQFPLDLVNGGEEMATIGAYRQVWWPYATIFNFSDSNGWEYTLGPKEIYIYDYDGNVNFYLNQYVLYLKDKLGDVNISSTLITLNELENLGCNINDDYSYTSGLSCANSPYEWLLQYSNKWWSRSIVSGESEYVWVVDSSGLLMRQHYGNSQAAIRPVITIDKDQIPTILNFTIDGVLYQADPGMTWEEWVNSKYNNIGAYVAPDYDYGDGIFIGEYIEIENGWMEPTIYLKLKNGEHLYSNEKIINNENYEFYDNTNEIIIIETVPIVFNDEAVGYMLIRLYPKMTWEEFNDEYGFDLAIGDYDRLYIESDDNGHILLKNYSDNEPIYYLSYEDGTLVSNSDYPRYEPYYLIEIN